MVPMARAAVRDGHEVRVVSGSDITALIERHGLAAGIAGGTLAQAYAAAAEANRSTGLAETFGAMDPQQAIKAAARTFFGAAAVPRTRDLLELIDRWRPDLIVHDTLELAAPTVAQIAGIPHALHSYGPLVPDQGGFATAIGAALRDAGLPDPIPGVIAAPYLDVCPRGLQPEGTAPWQDVIPVRPSAGDIPAGESLPAGFADLPHDTTLYLTLGTVTNEAPAVIRAVLDACALRPINVVVTTGPGADTRSIGADRPWVLAVPYLSQALVLPHCAAVVSHCGAGTMFGALSFGLPQLCLPQGTDQPSNAAAVGRAGAGVVLTPDRVTVDSVATALEQVLDGPDVRAAATRLQAEIAGMPTPADALKLLIRRIAT